MLGSLLGTRWRPLPWTGPILVLSDFAVLSLSLSLSVASGCAYKRLAPEEHTVRVVRQVVKTARQIVGPCRTSKSTVAFGLLVHHVSCLCEEFSPKQRIVVCARNGESARSCVCACVRACLFSGIVTLDSAVPYR